MVSKEDKLKAIDLFMTKVLKPDAPTVKKAEELVLQFQHIYDFSRFPEFSDIWGWEFSALDDLSVEELKQLIKEYTNGEYKGERFIYLKIGKQYIHFTGSGEIRLSRKASAKMRHEVLKRLPFNVDLAIKSGIIQIEEEWE